MGASRLESVKNNWRDHLEFLQRRITRLFHSIRWLKSAAGSLGAIESWNIAKLGFNFGGPFQWGEMDEGIARITQLPACCPCGVAQSALRRWLPLEPQAQDLQLPVGKSIGGKRPVGVIVNLGRAVRLEVLRDLGLAIFAGKRLGRDERPLARIGERLRLVENALDPRLLGKSLSQPPASAALATASPRVRKPRRSSLDLALTTRPPEA